MQDLRSEFKKHQNDKYETISFCEKPQSVKVITSLPTSGEKPTFQEIPLSEFEKKYGFTWIDGISGPSNFINKFVNPVKIASHLTRCNNDEDKAMLEGIKSSPKYMKNSAVYHTPKMGNGLKYVGESVIAKGTVTGFYGGEIAEACEKGDGIYASSGLKSKLFIPSITDGPTSCVDGEHWGNISRFINAAPQNLDDYEFAQGVNTKEIATANIEPTLFIVDEIPLKVYKANQEIQPGDNYLYDYGPNYWAARELKNEGAQLLTKKDGTVIPPYLYRLKKIPVHFRDKNNQWHYSFISVDQCREIIDNPKKSYGVAMPSGELPRILKPEEAAKALARHNYAYGGKLTNCDQIDQSQPQENILGLEILQNFVDEKFRCYKRKVNNKEYDLKIIDAVIEVKDEKEKKECLMKFAHTGLFPLIIGNKIIIEGINQEKIKENLSRLSKTRCATEKNKAGVTALKSSDFPKAIDNFNQSILIWTYLSEENPLLQSNVAIAHHNLALAYQRSGNVSHAIVHFHLSEVFYRQCGDIKSANSEKVAKEALLQGIDKIQNSSSVIATTSQMGMTTFPLAKTENTLIKLESLVKLFKTEPDKYNIEYGKLPQNEKRILELFLQIEGLYKIEYGSLKIEETNTSTLSKKASF